MRKISDKPTQDTHEVHSAGSLAKKKIRDIVKSMKIRQTKKKGNKRRWVDWRLKVI